MSTITVNKHKVRKKLVWVVGRREGGKRRRSFFSSKDEADSEAERLRANVAESGSVWLTLPAHDRSRLIQAYHEAQKRGLDLMALINGAPANVVSPKLATVIDELIASKEKAGRADRYTTSLKAILKQFASDRDVPISAITLADLEKWLDGKKLASRSTNRSRLATLFKFSVRRGYCPSNPCERLEAVTVAKAPPAVFTMTQIKACLKWFRKRPKAFPWFVLSCCCGLRPEEAEQTRKADIHIEEGWIKVEAQTTKVRQRRVVYPKPEAMALLARAMKKKGKQLPINRTSRRRELRDLRTHLKLKTWPKDITRHTAASYWIADCQSAAHVAQSLGNSEKILKQHYQAIKTKEEARLFWELLTVAGSPSKQSQRARSHSERLQPKAKQKL